MTCPIITIVSCCYILRIVRLQEEKCDITQVIEKIVNDDKPDALINS